MKNTLLELSMLLEHYARVLELMFTEHSAKKTRHVMKNTLLKLSV